MAVQKNAYTPYSRFPVGAAILSVSGKIFSGCNIENASFGLTICAERCAVATAVAAGERQWKAIAIASRSGVTPCGACRQVLVEFGMDFEVLLVDSESEQITARWKISELLPGAFELEP